MVYGQIHFEATKYIMTELEEMSPTAMHNQNGLGNTVLLAPRLKRQLPNFEMLCAHSKYPLQLLSLYLV